MGHDRFWLSESHGSEPSPYCTKRLQSVMFIVIKHIKDILNFILFSIFKTVILVFLEFKSEAGKNSRKFENILSVTTTVGVNLFVSLLSDSNRIKQQPLMIDFRISKWENLSDWSYVGEGKWWKMHVGEEPKTFMQLLERRDVGEYVWNCMLVFSPTYAMLHTSPTFRKFFTNIFHQHHYRL